MNILRRTSTAALLTGAMLAGLFLLVFATDTPPAARADTGPALEEPTIIGSALSPYKFVSTRVRMVDEQVRMKVQPLTVEQKLYHTVDVLADFHFYNTSVITESMQAVFPLTDLKCPWVAGPGSWTIREDVVDEPSFQVSVGGQPVVTEPLTTTTIITQSFAAPAPPLALECLTNWKRFAVTFPPRQDVRIQVSYRMQPPFDLGAGMQGYPWDSFTYILKTGAPWYGSIRQVDISLELPYPARREQFLKLPAGYRIDQNTIRWRWRNIEPRNNLQIVMLSTQTQTDLAESLESVKTNPKDSQAWAKQAGVYESLSWRHDYQAGCGSTIEYATFPQVVNWKYARLAQSAYQRLLELSPQDGEARANYANLLAEMSLSANQGVLMSQFPSVKRTVKEFERALALEKTERAQQLLDSYQHCIVGSKADQPVCQCGF